VKWFLRRLRKSEALFEQFTKILASFFCLFIQCLLFPLYRLFLSLLEQTNKNEKVRVFRQQMHLAAKLGRPASLHSVRCPGFMFDELRHAQELPPAVSKRQK